MNKYMNKRLAYFFIALNSIVGIWVGWESHPNDKVITLNKPQIIYITQEEKDCMKVGGNMKYKFSYDENISQTGYIGGWQCISPEKVINSSELYFVPLNQ